MATYSQTFARARRQKAADYRWRCRQAVALVALVLLYRTRD